VRPIELLLHKGCLAEEREMSAGHSVMDSWSSRQANLGAPFKVVYLRQYFNYKWYYTNRLTSGFVCLIHVS
jgi:hypothetical protein